MQCCVPSLASCRGKWINCASSRSVGEEENKDLWPFCMARRVCSAVPGALFGKAMTLYDQWGLHLPLKLHAPYLQLLVAMRVVCLSSLEPLGCMGKSWETSGMSMGQLGVSSSNSILSAHVSWREKKGNDPLGQTS